MPRILSLAVAAAVLAAALATAAWSRSTAPSLTGTVGPGFTISLTQGGTKVKTLKAGTYSLTVTDKASIHDFAIAQQSGGHFQLVVTTVPFTGTKTVTVKLTKGSWKVYCQPHKAFMFQTFTVS